MYKNFYKYRYFAYTVIFVLISILLFWKCRYGYANSDEAFYPTIAHRLLQGDKLLYDEWHGTQLSALIIMPFLKAYQLIKGDYVGVYLFLRYAYTILKICISVAVFIGIKKYGEGEAFLSSILFLAFCCHGLMVISYNTIAVGGVLCWILFLLNGDVTKKGYFRYSLGGVCLALAILGIPHIVGVYFVYVIAVAVNYFGGKNERYLFFSPKALLGTTIGAGAVAAALFIYLFCNISMAELSKALPFILNGDAEHEAKGLYRSTAAYLVRILIGNDHNYLLFGTYCLLLIVLVIPLLKGDRIRKNISSELSVIILCLGIVALNCYFLHDEIGSYLNDIIFVPNIVTPFLMFVWHHDDKIREIFYCIWLPGMWLTYFEYLASNTGFSGVSAFSCIATIGSVLIIFQIFNAINKGGRYIVPIFYGIIFCCCLYYRMTYIFWEEGDLKAQETKITTGVAKGLVVTSNEAENYYKILSDTEEMRQLPEDAYVLYIGDKMLWVSGNQRCGCYSPYTYSITNTREILYEYLDLHPDKRPDAAYIEFNTGNETIAKELADYLGYDYEKEQAGWIIIPAT